jgi:hypothetical protein
MPLFEIVVPAPAPVVAVPKEVLLRRAAQQLRQTAERQFNQLCRLQREGIEFMWDNPQGLTPQDVCDAAGVDAGKYLTSHGALTGAITAAAAAFSGTPDIALPTHAFTINPDGTATVGEGPYIP